MDWEAEVFMGQPEHEGSIFYTVSRVLDGSRSIATDSGSGYIDTRVDPSRPGRNRAAPIT